MREEADRKRRKRKGEKKEKVRKWKQQSVGYEEKKRAKDERGYEKGANGRVLEESEEESRDITS